MEETKQITKPKNTFIKRLKKEITKAKVTKTLEYFVECSSLIIRLRAKPRWYDMLALGLQGSKTLSATWELWSGDRKTFDEIEENPEWHELKDISEHSITLVKKCIGDRKIGNLSSTLKTQVYVGYLEGKVELAWRKTEDNKWPTNQQIFCKEEDEEKIYEILHRLSWRGENHIEFSKDGISIANFDNVSNLRMHPDFVSFFSEIKHVYDNGIVRSYMVYGVPGVGKTTGIKQVIKALGAKSMHIDLSSFDLTYYGSAATALSLTKSLNLLQPDIIIMDDIDRIYNQEVLLSFLEKIRIHAKLIFFTANNTNKMIGAALRPGRVDEIITVSNIDEDILKYALEDYYKEFDLDKYCANWPFCFVVELKTKLDLLKALNKEIIIKDIICNFEKRIDRVNNVQKT